MLVPTVALKQGVFNPGAPLILHRHQIEHFVIFLLVLGLCSNNAFGQQPADAEVIRVSTDLSVFPIRVTNKKRQAAPGLTATDFQMRDVDRVTTSLYFAAGADRVALVFALDQSGSLRDIISQQRDAAVALFEHFNAASRVAVIRFSEQPGTVVPFGKDGAAVRAAFNFSPRLNSHTAIFDAAAAAVSNFDDSVHDPAERRIVILISDGLDNASTTKPASVIARAQAKNVSFYTIQIPLFEPRDGRLAVRGPARGFRELSDKTGGRYFLVGDARSALEPEKKQDLSPVFSAIEEDLKSQYVVGFYVAEGARDGRAHRVSISVTRPGLVYSVAQYGYNRTHDFFVNLTPRKTITSPE